MELGDFQSGNERLTSVWTIVGPQSSTLAKDAPLRDFYC
jgi:hypothetical protein